MDEQLFTQHFKPNGEAESSWLTDVFNFVSQNLCPVLPESTVDRISAHQLSLSVVEKIQEHMCVKHTLPVSYKFVSTAELLSLQHLPCVSNLSWSTSQHRAWAKEAVLTLPDHKALSRVSLLLIGCLKAGPGGEWKLMDASGDMSCQLLSTSHRWLNCPVFLPHWNYIPYNSVGSDQDSSRGYVEVIGCPVLLCVSPEPGLSSDPGRGPELCRAVGLKETVCQLRNRTPRQRLSVCGRVGSVCPLLVVSGTSFFCFSLTDDVHSLPILVKEPSKLWWAQCLPVGRHVCVTALRVCTLQGWRGKNILCATDGSEMHTGHTHTFDSHSHSEPDRPASVTMSHIAEDDDADVDQPNTVSDQSAVRTKRSKVINYQGMVTEVVSEGAGLYVIDRKVGVCLAYQPCLRRKLRVGDTVEVSHVHFLYRPCPDFPKVMLATCLRSSLRVTAFSRVGSPTLNPRCPDDGVLTRLLLEKNLAVSEYLWSCHLSSQLSRSLSPSVLKQCVCLLSWKLLEYVWGRRRERTRRDIYSEMLDESHACPLSVYSINPSAPRHISVAELSQSLLSDCWSVSLRSLLPPGGPDLTSAEINSALSWSCKTVSSDPSEGGSTGQRPLLLVGVLALPPQTSEQSVQLRDGTGAVGCVLTESDQRGEQSAVFNTAWIGCLVCVQKFTMTTERCIQSDFPSYQHLEQDKYITHKNCRIYLQFSLDHVHILSPSAAMATLLALQVKRSGEWVTDRKRDVEEGDEGSATAERKKRRKQEEEDSTPPVTAGLPGRRPCASVIIRLQHKEGVAWRNTEAGQSDGEAGLTLCFSARVAAIGPVVTWEHDPKNGAMTDKEVEPQEEFQVLCLLFAGTAARWSAVLQPGFFYRLIATDTEDLSVLTDSGVCAQAGVQLHIERSLQVRPEWRFHTLTQPLLLPVHRQALSPKVLTVSEVLNCSLDMVCFQALLYERTSVTDRTGDKNTGVRLTVCDQSGRSLQVYMDLSHTTHPLGLTPGNTLLFSAFQRRLSRAGSVYCRFLPVSSVSVLSTGDLRTARPAAPPTMHLGQWEGSSVGQVKGHVVCFLSLQLQWSCSLCRSVFKQSCSSQQCVSTSAVFQPKAKVVIDDGTGEAHVRVSGTLVQPLLGLADNQWEGLQRAIKVRGHLEVKPWGRSLTCDSDDPLLHFLLSVLSGEALCRQLLLTGRILDHQRPEEMKRFTRRDRDFMTRIKRPLQLTCLSLTCLTAPA